MVYLFTTLFTYYLLLWGAARLLPAGREAEPARRLAVAYWLVNVPLLLPGLLWVYSSRWSLSPALQPVWLGLLLLSGALAGAYLRVARLRWPLLSYALLLGLVYPLWLAQSQAAILYAQYPLTVKAANREYAEEPESFWDNKNAPTTYRVTEFYRASWGLNYYVGEVRLDYPPSLDLFPAQNLEALSDSIWQRVRSLQYESDSSKGRLTFAPLRSAGKYNAFAGRVELPREQVLDFWVTNSPAPRQRPH